jgi:hypothetical protein
VNPTLYTALEALFFAILTGAVIWALEHYWGVWRLLHGILRVSLWRRSAPMRVSFSAILRLSSGDRYVLARMGAHPWAFGPFGGVYHAHDAASSVLHACEFQTMSTAGNPADLRGLLPRRHFLTLLRWFFRGRDRESGDQCLRRELREELREVHEESLIQWIDRLHFRLIRAAIEHPRRVPGPEFIQFRCFHVYELDQSDRHSTEFVEALLERAHDNPNLLIATSSEIIIGRCRENLIGHHCEYLFRRRASRPDLPQADFNQV